MKIEELFKNREIKPSEKVIMLSAMLDSGRQSCPDILEYAKRAKPAEKASCIEAVEHSSKDNPEIVSREFFEFAVESLSDKAPRVKHESARVIANSCSAFRDILEPAIVKLADNSADPGTVVRWSAAMALSAIASLNTPINKDLLSLLEKFAEFEDKNSIKKIYLTAIKKAGKGAK